MGCSRWWHGDETAQTLGGCGRGRAAITYSVELVGLADQPTVPLLARAASEAGRSCHGRWQPCEQVPETFGRSPDNTISSTVISNGVWEWFYRFSEQQEAKDEWLSQKLRDGKMYEEANIRPYLRVSLSQLPGRSGKNMDVCEPCNSLSNIAFHEATVFSTCKGLPFQGRACNSDGWLQCPGCGQRVLPCQCNEGGSARRCLHDGSNHVPDAPAHGHEGPSGHEPCIEPSRQEHHLPVGQWRRPGGKQGEGLAWADGGQQSQGWSSHAHLP